MKEKWTITVYLTRPNGEPAYLEIDEQREFLRRIAELETKPEDCDFAAGVKLTFQTNNLTEFDAQLEADRIMKLVEALRPPLMLKIYSFHVSRD